MERRCKVRPAGRRKCKPLSKVRRFARRMWAKVRRTARYALEWFVNEGADALGEVVAGVGLLGLVLLLPIFAAFIG